MTEGQARGATIDEPSADDRGTDSAPVRRPRVSVCIPAYQAEQYLQGVVDSVLAQDYPNLELVVVDNNSSDGTRAILEAVKDDRLRVIRNTTTLPVFDNWNFTVRQARGDFVKLICVDDTLEPDCISAQAAVLESMPEVRLVAVRTNYIDDDDEVIAGSRGLLGMAGRVPAEQVVRQIVRSGGNPIGGPVAVMFRRADFERSGGFTTDFPFLADMDLWVRLLHNGDFYSVPGTHASFRIRGGSIHGLTSARDQLAQSIEFDKLLGDDPRWSISVSDRIHGRVRCYEQQLRRTVLFASTKWRVKRRRRRPVMPQEVPETDSGFHSSAKAESLSTVICAYTTARWGDLCQSVESVLAQDFTASNVVVVIDHCPELYQMARDRFGSDERVTVLENNKDRGLSGARNAGVDAADGDVIAFVDDDAVAEPGWARALMRHYRHERVAGVGGYASPVWPEHRPTWMPTEFDWVVGCSYTGQPTQLAAVRNPLGCNMSLRRSVLDTVGGFRSEVGRVGSHPVGGEETELCIRVGAKDPSAMILFDPEARVRHNVSTERTTLRYFRRRCFHEGMSKAVVTELVGAPKALTTERAYTLSVLPRAILRESMSMRGEGFARAGVMMLGLTVTTYGYLNAKARRWPPTRRAR
jgi:glycosyltransferase involved in cell wall biosynthesis